MKLRFAGLAAFLIVGMSGTLLAQGALFTGFGFPNTVTATGQTEVIGSVMASLRVGTTAADSLVINVSPLQITNASAADIRVTATGITVGATTIDAVNSLVRIPVNAGAASGSIRVDGIRVAVAGTGITSFNAQLSWQNSLNVFTSGTSVPVINSVQSGLLADPLNNPFVIFNGQIYRNNSSISVHEGYASAFSSSTNFGQTGSTNIKIRVTDFPANLQMTFPATVTSPDSGATLNTLEGSAVVLPRSNGNTEVTYAFSGVSGSDNIVESFQIPFTVSLTGMPSILQPTIEVSLAPIGAAVPNAIYPSTAIPRYAEDELLVQPGTSRIITKILYWTGADASVPAQINVLNPSSNSANLTIDGLGASGQPVSGNGITNPVKLSLSANQSLVQTVSGLFGSATGISTVRIQSTNSGLLATVTLSGNGGTESVPFIAQALLNPFIPVVNESANVQLFNPNNSAITGTLTLRSEDGGIVSSAPVNLASLASTSIALAGVFNNPPRGYVVGDFSFPVIAYESFGSPDTNMLAIGPAGGGTGSSLYIPFFADGNGFQADLNLLNASDETFTLQAQIFNSAGSASGTPVAVTFGPKQQVALPVDQLFSQVPSTGYIRLDLPQLMKGFFTDYPDVTGYARIRTTQGGSTVIPLSRYPFQDSFVLGASTGANEFQGIALVNPTGSPVSVTLQVLNPAGATQKTASVNLNPGQIVSRLATEFFGAAVPAQSVLRVTASSPVVTAVITASNTLNALSSLPIVR